MNTRWIVSVISIDFFSRWAIVQDVGGAWRLDGDVWLKNGAADHLNSWVRMIYRYAQIALIADSVGLWNERRTVLAWLEKSLMKFFSNRFDHQGLLYDSTWGGIIPCGCDRNIGRKFCIPPPRLGYFNQINSSRCMSIWMAQSCPALRNTAVEGGAGFFADHHALWGYIVFSTAVATRFNPTFVNRRVRLETGTGVRRPKIHHLTISLIQDYANPMLVEPFESPYDLKASEILHRYFPGARYKDWWRLHSYGSNIATSGNSIPSQYSLSEAAFGYWGKTRMPTHLPEHMCCGAIATSKIFFYMFAFEALRAAHDIHSEESLSVFFQLPFYIHSRLVTFISHDGQSF